MVTAVTAHAHSCHVISSCWRGNVAEFLLNTKFPQKDLEFFCNVELDERVPLISLDYTVLHTNTELKTFSVNIQQNESSVRQTSFRYDQSL